MEEPGDAEEPDDAGEPDNAGEPDDAEEPDDVEEPDDTEVPEIPEDPQIPNDLGTPDNPEPSPPAILPAERATPPEAARAVGAVLLLEPEDDVAEISQGDQLIQWMEEHKRAGGKAVLTQDVRIDSPYRYSYVRGGKPVEIDTGGYTLIIEDYVYLEGFSNLTIDVYKRQIYSYEQLYDNIWNEPLNESRHNVQARIASVRQKLFDLCPGKEYIQTVRRKGYQFVP